MNSESKLLPQPIPPLSATLDACMQSMSPFLNKAQRLKSKMFLGFYRAASTNRQKKLIALSQTASVNWSAEGQTRHWLSCRLGLPFYNNYAIKLRDEQSDASMTNRAARLTLAALDLYRDVRLKRLRPDVEARMPLDMTQYRHCFGVNRVPRPDCDELAAHDGTHHIAVLAAGYIYCLSVDIELQRLDWRGLQRALDWIAQDAQASERTKEPPGPGIFSALPRAHWAAVRKSLLQHEINQEALATLNKALFVLCLDSGSLPGSLPGITALLRDGNCHNRYYDKSMQIIVTENAKAGLSFERAAVDGSVALGVAERLHAKACALLQAPAPAKIPPGAAKLRARRLAWFMGGDLAKEFAAARNKINETRSGRRVETWTTPGVGSERLQKCRVGMDAMVQLAIQLATYSCFSRILKTYEPVQMRRFAGGRMEFICPVTPETKAVVQALKHKTPHAPAIAELIRTALDAHHRQIQQAKKGRGQAGHLLALDAARFAGQRPKGTRVHARRQALLAHLDKGLGLFITKEIFAANGSGAHGIDAFCPIGVHQNMISIGYVIAAQGITFDLRTEGRYGEHARALKTALEQALQTLVEIMERWPAA